jgi:hypothetical protein
MRAFKLQVGGNMRHPMVLQLRFTRSEFRRAIAKLSEEDASVKATIYSMTGMDSGSLFRLLLKPTNQKQNSPIYGE